MVMTKDEDKIREEIDVDAATISFQSKERRNVYLYLRLTFPEWMSIGEIANNLGSDYDNVKGALIGDGERYSKNYSLKNVGLAESKKKTLGGTTVILYRANRKGSRKQSHDKKKE
jgi:predicted transcriptional regulator with HTH domain